MKSARAALLAVVLAAVLAPPASAAPPKSDCATAGATVERAGHTRVYRVKASGETRTYGCWTKTGDRLRLDLRCDPDDLSPEGDDACRDTPSDIAIKGPHVALAFFGFYAGEGGETFTTIIRANVRHPKRDEVVQLDNDSEFEVAPIVERLFVSRRGGVAYSASNVQEGSSAPEVKVVGKVTPQGSDVRLDSGPAVDAKSLRAHGKQLVWQSGGLRKTARWR